MTLGESRQENRPAGFADGRAKALWAWWCGLSPWMVLPAMTWVAALLAASRPIFDVDSYWHVLIGRDIWSQHRFTGNPDMAFAPHTDWVTTQWGSEMLMAGSHAIFGWHGLTLLRLAAMAVTAAGLALITLRGQGNPARALVLAVATIAVAFAAQERPATFVLPLVVVLAHWARRLLADGPAPKWWAVTILTVLWVNMHGTWLLVPVTFAAVALVLAVQDRRFPVRLLPLLAVSAVAGACSPAGLYTFRAPLAVGAAARAIAIAEWKPATITGPTFALVLALVALTAVCGMRARSAVPLAPTLFMFGFALFASLANRNAPVSVILIAPVAADLLAATWPVRQAVWTGLGRGVATALAAMAIPVGVGHAIVSGGLPADLPYRAIASISAEPGPRRVIADYNTAGPVLGLSRPGVSVAVDGRTDRYGPVTLDRFGSLCAVLPGWQETLASLRPTDALLPAHSPLVGALHGLGWVTRADDAGFVHLTDPRADTGSERDG